MVTHPNFKPDLNRLCQLPFKREKRVGTVFKRVYGLIETATDHPDHEWLSLIKEWLLVPYTLWRIPYDGMALHMCKAIEAGERFDEKLVLLLELSDDLPSQEEQEMIIEFERFVEKGDYDPFVPGKAKYDVKEKELFNNPRYKKQWDALKKLFNVDLYRDSYGILRRTPAQERNFRGKDWKFRWDEEKFKFEHVFDAFAIRWILFGVEDEQPLLQKLTLNATAMGWIMYWPSYWSIDARRDIAWPTFSSAQRARGVQRQGAKMSEGRFERQKDALIAYAASLEARRRNFRGEKRLEHIRKALGLREDTIERAITRLVAEGRRLSKENSKSSRPRKHAALKNDPGTEDSKPVEAPNLKLQTSSVRTTMTSPNPKLERARAAINDLGPEEKMELMNLLAV